MPVLQKIFQFLIQHEKIQIMGEFAEVFEKKDSAIVTINPIAVNT